MQCWCGNTFLIPFGGGYLRCDRCQTLVSERLAAPVDDRVKNDSQDLYGREYWFSHQTADLDCPDIVTRARTDLPERCIHWLRSVLQFVLPPARVLEIGCAHGGFVAMLGQAGFDAIGLELSPSIIALAKSTFSVATLQGAIEDQHLPSGSFDAIVMMDVMEHLPSPNRTLARCLDLLKPGGVMLIQMPCYPAGQSLEALRDSGHQFPRMLDPREHLYLYSEASARSIFAELGARHIEFLPAIFGFYDMSFIVSRHELRRVTLAERDAALMSSVHARFILALLDLDDRRLNLLAKYRALRDEKAKPASSNNS